jgi:hypothetical protein
VLSPGRKRSFELVCFLDLFVFLQKQLKICMQILFNYMLSRFPVSGALEFNNHFCKLFEAYRISLLGKVAELVCIFHNSKIQRHSPSSIHRETPLPKFYFFKFSLPLSLKFYLKIWFLWVLVCMQEDSCFDKDKSVLIPLHAALED